MREKNLNLRPSENLYVTTYEDGEVEYIPCTPDEHEKEEKHKEAKELIEELKKLNNRVKELEDALVDKKEDNAKTD